MSHFEIDPFFPDKNLNPQGWVTDFITSRLRRVGKDRSDLASIIYDEKLSDEAKKLISSEALVKEIQDARVRSPKDCSIYLNPLYYDAVERNTAISAQVVEDEKMMRDYFKYMIGIKPNQLSSFVPYVRMKFGYKEANEKTFKEVEVPFVQNLKTEVASILSDQYSRGQGAGITGINADRSFPGLGLTLSINVTVKYFFSSISVITKKITNSFIPEELNFTYSKLFSFLPSRRQKLFLEYGYQVNPDDTNLLNLQINDIIKAETKRIPLAYKSHKLNIQEDGTITVDVNYLAESEARFFQKNDVTAPSIDYISRIKDPSLKSVYQNYVALNEEYYKIQDELREFSEKEVELQQAGANKKKLQNIKKQKETKQKQSVDLAKQLLVIKNQVMPEVKKLIYDALLNKKQLFSLSFTSEKKDKQYIINTYLNLVKYNKDNKQEFVAIGKPYTTIKNLDNFKNYDISVLQDNTVNLTKEALFEQILNNLFDTPIRASGSSQFGFITFFPLKALISIMYEFLPNDSHPSTKYKTPYVCFGNAVTRSFDKEYAINIGDILVELNTFNLWLHKNYVQKNRLEYSFSSFMTDLVEELVPEILYKRNTGFYKQNALGSIRHLNYFTKEAQLTPDNLKAIYTDNVDFNKLKQFFAPATDKDAEPMIYYTQMLSPLNDYTSPYHKKYIAKQVAGKGTFDLKQDAALGIPHVYIGAATGLIKKINFNAIEQPFLATSLVMNAMVDGNTTLPRYAYNASVEMFGNNLFNQAGFLAVPPFGIEGNADVALGLTGYYVVTKVSDSLSKDGGYSTSISAIWHDNPLRKIQAGSIATLKEAKELPNLIEYITYSADNYIKDLLKLDPNTLKALGVTANPVKQDKKTNEEKKNADKKSPKRDCKEKAK